MNEKVKGRGKKTLKSPAVISAQFPALPRLHPGCERVELWHCPARVNLWDCSGRADLALLAVLSGSLGQDHPLCPCPSVLTPRTCERCSRDDVAVAPPHPADALKDTLVRANATHVNQQRRIGPDSNYFRFPHLLLPVSNYPGSCQCPASCSLHTLGSLQAAGRPYLQLQGQCDCTYIAFLASNRSISNARVIKN